MRHIRYKVAYIYFAKLWIESSQFFCLPPINSSGEKRLQAGQSLVLYGTDQLWAFGIVPWSFVETSDIFSTVSIHTDSNVVLTVEDFETARAAMKQIESKTCIKFKLGKPSKRQPWLFITRDNGIPDGTCQCSYLQSLLWKDISGLGNIYSKQQNTGKCFNGGYARYGSSSPQIWAISLTNLASTSQGNIGFLIHELLHNHGIGHTQKGKLHLII